MAYLKHAASVFEKSPTDTFKSMGSWVYRKRRVSPADKLRNHSGSAHGGKVLDGCPACKELQAAATGIPA